MPIINKETFHTYLHKLLETEVLTSVQHYQYGTPVFIIFNKGGNMRFIMDN